MTLTVDAVEAGTHTRLVVTGDLDLLTVPTLTHLLRARLDAAAPDTLLVVDTAGVGFCGAAGVRVLTDAVHRARDRGVRVRVDPRSPAVDLALDICGELGEVGDAAPTGTVLPFRRRAPRPR